MKLVEPCALIGILDDGWDGLSDTARRRLASADVLIGATRTLALVHPYRAAGAEVRAMEGALGNVPGWVEAARAAGRSVAVLATGDPLCHGIGGYLIEKLGRTAVVVLPAPSTLQLACARFGKPWQDVAIASCHGRDTGEWHLGATPEHGLYPLMRAIALHRRVCAFTGPGNSAARLARALILAGDGELARLSVACRLMLPDEAVFIDLTPAEAAVCDFPEPNVLLVERPPGDDLPAFGLEDGEYRQRTPERGLMTKQEARALALAKLRLKPDALVWDIGAGSGAVGLDAARLAPRGHVWAIEKNPDDAANARMNAACFRAGNYTLCEGKAPAFLDSWPDPDAVFIGGSGGELVGLIGLALRRLRPGGRLAMNFTTLENLATATATLKALRADWEITQLQASRTQPILDLHRLVAQNPVWIVTARKEST